MTIRRAGQGVTTVVPANADIDVNANAVFGSLGPNASSVFLVEADAVTIRDLTVDGNNPLLTSGQVLNGVDVDARNGIITNHALGVFNNLEVHHVAVKNIYLRGIYASSGGTFNFHHNTVEKSPDRMRRSASSIRRFGRHRQQHGDKANDAISSNWSTGVTFTNNTVTDSQSGIHTDNAQVERPHSRQSRFEWVTCLAAATASGCSLPYQPITIDANEVKDVDVGIGVFGSDGSAPLVTITGNDVDLFGRGGSVGACGVDDAIRNAPTGAARRSAETRFAVPTRAYWWKGSPAT